MLKLSSWRSWWKISKLNQNLTSSSRSFSTLDHGDDLEPTLFDKILRKEIPAKIAYEDEHCLAFHDVMPQAPVHLLLIPKKRAGLSQLSKAQDKNKEILGHLMLTVGKIAKEQGLDDGFRVVINDGKKSGQTVYHLHLHILGCKGTPFTWPPGTPGNYGGVEKKPIN